MQQAFIGVDVGTASARAGVFDARGALLSTARHPIALWHEPGDIVEQSSPDIWQACVRAVRGAMQDAGLQPSAVAGVGFDATCSLVALDRAARPLAIGSSGDPQRNVIVWMDHRATGEARQINEGEHDVLRYVGGLISPEMETPKLLWLKRQLPQSFHAAGHFFDLADFLTFRATGSTTRSACTVTCKWTYLAHERRWSDEYLRAIGLTELLSDSYARIGRHIVAPGTPLAHGLTPEAAVEFGLVPGTPVGASLIDAHAGAVGTLGAAGADGAPVELQSRLAYIMGTSACIMATTAEPRFVPGIWGPYFSALLPGLWLNEGGQSAAGAGIDHLTLSHPAHAEALAAAKESGLGLLEFLERRALARFGNPAEAALLARDIHVLPEFLGNRSPHADPGARAVIAGLDLDADIASLERLFVAGLCGLAYGLADVVYAMRAEGIVSKTMMISGGGARSGLVRQIVADATGLSVALPETAEPVLLGAAMLGAVAAKAYPSIFAAMATMSRLGPLTEPTTPVMANFHAAKRRVYAQMQQLDRQSRTIMGGVHPGRDR